MTSPQSVCLGVLLQSKGIQSLEAENGVDALRILRKLGDEIDLVITDVQMPGHINGVALAYAAKNLISCVPVILVSGNAEKAPEGFTFIRKSFTGDAILNAVDKALIRTRAGGARWPMRSGQ